MTLADALAGKGAPVAIAGKSRVHRMDDDPEPEQATDERGQPVPAITPFIAGGSRDEVVTARGVKNMPKGIYKRKPRTPTDPTASDAPEVKGKAARKRRAKKANGDARRPPPRSGRVLCRRRHGADLHRAAGWREARPLGARHEAPRRVSRTHQGLS